MRRLQYNIRMIMEKKQDQWQGFEEFCEPHNIPESQPNNQDKNEAEPPRVISTDNLNTSTKKQLPEQKPKTSPHKKTKIKIKVYELSPKKEQQIGQPQVEEAKNEIHNDGESPRKLTIRQNRFERIPIMRKEDDFRYTGNIVYRSFVPRSSDTYFRTLKQVDYSAPLSEAKFKGNELYYFNSRIESGNLGSVFQGWRV